MPDPIRTFIAIPVAKLPGCDSPLVTNELPADLRRVWRLVNEAGRAMRPTPLATLHITLCFTGDTPTALVPDIATAMDQVAVQTEPFPCELHGLGVFPDERRPAVVWAGMRDDAALRSLAGRLWSELEKRGFPPEQRRFHPHLTLARLRTRAPQALFNLLATHRESPLGQFEVRCIQLVQSQLTPSGPLYSPLHTSPLGHQH